MICHSHHNRTETSTESTVEHCLRGAVIVWVVMVT